MRRIFGIVDRVQLFDLAFGIILDHDFERPQHRHHARRALVQIFADAVLQHGDIDRAVALGHADALAKRADRFRRVAAAAKAANGRHARIVPTA